MKYIFLVCLVLASSSLCNRLMRSLRRRHLGDEKSCFPPYYDRGVGKAPECQDGYESDGALLCYKKCKEGYKGSVCQCVSRTNWQDWYNRGCGVAPPRKCKDDEEMQGGLCYPKCRSQFKGRVTMCLGECKQFNNMWDCGGVCTESREACNSRLTSSIDDFFNSFTLNLGKIKDNLQDFAHKFGYAECH